MFAPIDRCWVCGGDSLHPYHQCRLDFREYARQDPELTAYTDERVWLVRCAHCGFGQPATLPTLPNFFDRMYDQRWAADWVEHEFESSQKDLIFRTILRTVSERVGDRRRLLDVGAHAGRFMHLAQQAGWDVEGVELNPRTAEHAAKRTGAPVHRVNAQTLAADGRRYSVVTLTDVLEHIPEPTRLLTTIADLVEPGGCVAVKVPCGPSQWIKERTLAALTSHKVSLAENLVHVNHFSPRSLALALERAGFIDVDVQSGAPELSPIHGSALRPMLSNALRLALYAAGAIPWGVQTPLTMNLQAYATKSGARERPSASERKSA